MVATKRSKHSQDNLLNLKEDNEVSFLDELGSRTVRWSSSWERIDTRSSDVLPTLMQTLTIMSEPLSTDAMELFNLCLPLSDKLSVLSLQQPSNHFRQRYKFCVHQNVVS
jgi:hypothetical protein